MKGLKLAFLSFMAMMLLNSAAFALPQDGNIVGGQGSISTNGTTMDVNQQTQRMAVDWGSFNIASQETVNFNQPNSSAMALNRILGNSGSEIYGKLNANGQVFLVNPNGVLFAPGAAVNVGGLVASTLNINPQDFMSGKYQFAKDSVAGSIINKGNITSDGGSVTLIGPSVSNQGVITANLGKVTLAAGEAATLDFNGDGLFSVTLDKAIENALVENQSLIKADGGVVVMTTKARNEIVASTINNTGIIEAKTLVNKNGIIELLSSGDINAAGTFDVSAASDNANAGSVKIFADNKTDFTGTILGTAINGDGGNAEVSGVEKVVYKGFTDLRSRYGLTGTLLLDPTDYYIAASGGDITGAAVGTALATANLTLQTSDAGSGNGDMFVNDAITWSSDYNLTLKAYRNININQDITNSGHGTLTLTADKNVVHNSGAVNFGGTISSLYNLSITSGGAVTQTNRILAGGTTNITTSGGAVSLNNASNNFIGAVSVDTTPTSGSAGANVSLADADALILGAIDTGSLGNLSVTAGGRISQAAGTQLAIGGTTTVTGGGALADVTLDNSGNDFGGAVSVTNAQAVSLKDTNSIALGNISASGNITVTAGTDITLNGDISKTSGNDATALLSANRNVILSTGADITSTSNMLTIKLNPNNTGVSGSGVGFVHLAGNNSIASNGGDIKLVGGASADDYAKGDTTNGAGIILGSDASLDNDIHISSGAGDVVMAGQGGDDTTGSVPRTGILIRGGVNISSTSGSIVLDGRGSQQTTGISNYGADGIDLVTFGSTGYSSQITSDSGNITLTGRGGVAGGGLNTDDGIWVYNESGDLSKAHIIRSMTGSVTLNGKSGETSGSTGMILGDNSLVIGGAGVSGDIVLGGDKMSFGTGNTVQSTGALTIYPYMTTSTIGIAGGAGTLSLPAAIFGGVVIKDGFSSVTIGDNFNTRAITIGGAVSFVDATVLLNASGNITIDGAVTCGSNNLTINAPGGGVSFRAAVSGVNNLAITADGTVMRNLTSTAPLTVAGTTTIATHGGEVALDDTGNDFSGEVNVDTTSGIGHETGAGVWLTDANDLTVGNIVGGEDGTVHLTATAGALTINNYIRGCDIELTQNDALVLSLTPITAGGSVTFNVTGSGNDITQDSGISTNVWLLTLTTTGGDIVLDTYPNRFPHIGVSTSGGNFSLDEIGSLHLSTVNTGSGSFTLTTTGNINQNGSTVMTVGGAATITSTGNNIILTHKNDFGGAVNLTGANVIINDVNSLTLGALNLTGDLDATAAGALNLGSGTIGSNLISTAGGDITQTGALIVGGTTTITANGGNVIMNDALNNFGGEVSLTGGGEVEITDVGDIALGNMSAVDLEVHCNGALTINTGKTLSISDSQENALLLDTGAAGVFVNNGDVSMTGGGGWWIFSANPANDTRGSLASAYDFKQYNTIYGGAIQGTGSGFIYSVAPVVSETLTGSITRVYDATTSAELTSSNYTAVSGAIDGDTVVLTQPSGTYDNKNVGTGKAVSVTGIALSTATSSTGKTVYGYTTTTTASGNIGAITKKDITAEGIAANSKVYDATTAATLNNDSARLNGVCTGDVVNLTTVSGGVFSDKNAGTGKTVTISGLVITGADSGNYTLTNADPYTTTADITPRQITVTADNKTKEFGAPDPPFTYTVGGSGFAGSETKADVFTGGLTRIPGEAPNKYDILQGTLTPNSNYAISLYTKGQLTINPMPVTPTINQVQMTQNSYNVLSTDSVGAGAASYGEGEKDSSGVPGDLKYVNTDSSTPAGRGSFILFVVNGGVNESL